MDPLSITAGIFAILSSSIRICVDIQSLRSGAAVADTAVQALFLDVDDFSRVLYLISETLNEDKDHVQATGHAGNLWRNVSCSVEKSQEVMIQLKGVLQRVDKNSNLASGLRKHIRLTAASEEISIYQQQIRTYRDTLQLSMHSIIIFKQSSLQGTVRMILPSLDLLHREFHKTQKEIMYLQTLMHSQQKDSTGDISNLRDTLRSAAEVASSASTIFIERDDTDKLSVVLDSITAQSELGDLLGQESELTQRWIFSNNSHSDQDFESRTAISGDPQVITVGPSERCQVENASLSRTTTDLDCMMIQALFHQGKTCFLAKDLGLAKRLLRRCMLEYEQIPGVEVPQVDRDEVSDLLLEIWLEQKDWDEAETMLKQRLNRMSDNANGLENATVVRYSLALAEVLFAKKIPVEAKLYGRKALQRYLSLGSNGVHGAEKALRLLIQICHSNEDIEDEEAYTAMLSFVQKQVAESTKDETSDVDSQATLGPTGPQHSVINMEKSTRRDEGTRVIRNPKPKSTPLPAIHLDINESIHAGRVIPETNGARKTRFPGITYMDNVDYTRDFESDGGYRDQFGHSLCESRRKLVFVGDCCGKSSLIL
ncbi:hypothetical protein BGZ60DRAFT_152893 [Tricladium varicosporioides]|nr:hypothetical protein BGZ60DRAFT_152893 [Hymenoscyphus varicosporioides]